MIVCVIVLVGVRVPVDVRETVFEGEELGDEVTVFVFVSDTVVERV